MLTIAAAPLIVGGSSNESIFLCLLFHCAGSPTHLRRRLTSERLLLQPARIHSHHKQTLLTFARLCTNSRKKRLILFRRNGICASACSLRGCRAKGSVPVFLNTISVTKAKLAFSIWFDICKISLKVCHFKVGHLSGTPQLN